MRIVSFDVSNVMSGELVDGLLDLGEASLLAHGQGREVGVGAGAVPISLLKAIKKLYFAKYSEKNISTKFFLFLRKNECPF